MPDAVPPDPVPGARVERALAEFVLLWGEMASAWGINRTMAQIHALLYASEAPLDTDEIMDRLQISRGNANMNLRALLDWNLIRKTHQLGSRKDYFSAEKDVWTIANTIIEERLRREIKPVQRALADLAQDLRSTEAASEPERALAERVHALVSIMDLFDGFSSVVLPLLRGRNADKLRRVVDYAARLRSTRNGEPGP